MSDPLIVTLTGTIIEAGGVALDLCHVIAVNPIEAVGWFAYKCEVFMVNDTLMTFRANDQHTVEVFRQDLVSAWKALSA